MPRTVISGLLCITFLMLLEFSAVPQQPARKGADADTESGQPSIRPAEAGTAWDAQTGPN